MFKRLLSSLAAEGWRRCNRIIDSARMGLKPGTSAYLRKGYLASNERVLFETHPSKWYYFSFPTLYLALLGFADYASASAIYSQLPAVGSLTGILRTIIPSSYGIVPNPRILLLVAFLIGTLAVTAWMLRRLYEWVSDTYVVTDDRIIEEKGIVRTVQQEIPLSQIRDVDVYQDTLFARAFRLGTVRFKSLSQQDIPGETQEQSMARSGGRVLPKSTYMNPLKVRLFNPRNEVAKISGVEWWVGVPYPVRIERTVEQALRSRTPGPLNPVDERRTM